MMSRMKEATTTPAMSGSVTLPDSQRMMPPARVVKRSRSSSGSLLALFFVLLVAAPSAFADDYPCWLYIGIFTPCDGGPPPPPPHKQDEAEWIVNVACTLPVIASWASYVESRGVNGAAIIVPTRDSAPRYLAFVRSAKDVSTPEGLAFYTFIDPNVALVKFNSIPLNNKGYVTAANGEIIVWSQDGPSITCGN